MKTILFLIVRCCECKKRFVLFLEGKEVNGQYYCNKCLGEEEWYPF